MVYTVGCPGRMRTLLNLIWFIFGGFWLFLGYIIWPFGRPVVEPTGGSGSLSTVSNVI